VNLPARLATDRLSLRPFRLEDLEGYVAYYTGSRTGGVGGPKPRHVVVERFFAMAGQWALRGYGRYGIAPRGEDGPAFGHVGVMHLDESDDIEMTWTLWDPAFEGRGYATEAARAVLDAWTGAPLVVRIAPDNARSIRVAERLGLVIDPGAVQPDWAQGFVTYRPRAAAA